MIVREPAAVWILGAVCTAEITNGADEQTPALVDFGIAGIDTIPVP